MADPDFVVEVYRGRKRNPEDRQVWRWRAIRGGNNRRMASSGEAYVNESDCIDAVSDLFGAQTTVYLWHPYGQAVVREGLPAVWCQRCGHGIVLHLTTSGCDSCECRNYWVGPQ